MLKNIARIQRSSSSRKAVILFYIGLSALTVLVPLIWLFDKIEIRWGEDAAIVSMTLAFIMVIFIVAGGMGIGFCIDYAIRRRIFIFRSPKPGNWVERTIKIWGHNLTELPKKKATCSLPCPVTSRACHNLTELSEKDATRVSAIPKANEPIPFTGEPIPEKAKRRGRRPTFTLTRWMDVAMVWELRDPNFHTFSLSDVISQKLGTATNGSPIMGDGVYYSTWRIPAIREINRLKMTSRPLSEDLQSDDKEKQFL